MQRASRYLSVLVGLIFLSAIAACSRQDTEQTAPPPPPQEPATPPPATSGSTAEPPALVGTAWVAEYIEGKGELDNPESTLEFLPDAQVAGGAGCNRYGGSVEISGDALKFGPLRATKMACDPALMEQEQKFLEALAAARVYKMKDGKLVLVDATETERVRLVPNNNPQN